jgi:HEAT repeat protein
MDGIAQLLVDLGHSSVEVRRRAVVALGELGDRRAVDPLITVLRDADQRIQVSAAQSLERIGTLEARAALEAWQAKSF